ncbi:hypothetical protein FRC12_015579 [Ceratobasidium sp. 428]|nr:hypothetical protein FRC12_015579 [Ceratobasidium sp. 428]
MAFPRRMYAAQTTRALDLSTSARSRARLSPIRPHGTLSEEYVPLAFSRPRHLLSYITMSLRDCARRSQRHFRHMHLVCLFAPSCLFASISSSSRLGDEYPYGSHRALVVVTARILRAHKVCMMHTTAHWIKIATAAILRANPRGSPVNVGACAKRGV